MIACSRHRQVIEFYLRKRFRNIHLPGDNAVDNTVDEPATLSLFKVIYPLITN